MLNGDSPDMRPWLPFFESSPLRNTATYDGKNVSKFCHSPLPHWLFLSVHCPPQHVPLSSSSVFQQPSQLNRQKEHVRLQREESCEKKGGEKQIMQGGENQWCPDQKSKYRQTREKVRKEQRVRVKRKRWREGRHLDLLTVWSISCVLVKFQVNKNPLSWIQTEQSDREQQHGSKKLRY